MLKLDFVRLYLFILQMRNRFGFVFVCMFFFLFVSCVFTLIIRWIDLQNCATENQTQNLCSYSTRNDILVFRFFFLSSIYDF